MVYFLIEKRNTKYRQEKRTDIILIVFLFFFFFTQCTYGIILKFNVYFCQTTKSWLCKQIIDRKI